jgi:hypothetical protein
MNSKLEFADIGGKLVSGVVNTEIQVEWGSDISLRQFPILGKILVKVMKCTGIRPNSQTSQN